MSSERIICAACGSNNFATQAACWKCGKPLASIAQVASPASPAASPYAPVSTQGSAQALNASATPLWSSVAMGLVFPFIAIPVGLVFLMLDDRRKNQIGWWNILFGLVGSVLNGIIVAASLAPLLMSVTRLLPGLGGNRNPAASAPDLGSEVAPLDLPGQRPFSSPPR